LISLPVGILGIPEKLARNLWCFSEETCVTKSMGEQSLRGEIQNGYPWFFG
jgi:hypothetical protein